MDLKPFKSGDRWFADVPGMTAAMDITAPDPANPRTMSDDRYPAIIADQRHYYQCNTVEEVEAFWLDHCEREGTEPSFGGREVDAYINLARWLANCPDCRTPEGQPVGMFVWDRNLNAMCLVCCEIFKVRFPAPSIRSTAIRLLAARHIENCNWNAHEGETLDELARENRWLLDDPTIMQDGLWVPASMRVGEPVDYDSLGPRG